MSDFVSRMVTRSTGATGLQPRIAPITAPDPWHEPVDLELATVEESVSRGDARESGHPRPTLAPPRPHRTVRAPAEIEQVVEHVADERASVVERMDDRAPAAARPRDLRADESRLAAHESPPRHRAPEPLDVPIRSAPVRGESPVELADLVERTDERETPLAPSNARAVPSLRARALGLGQRELAQDGSLEDLAIVEIEREAQRENQRTEVAPSQPFTASPEHARRPSARAATLDPTQDVPRPARRRESTRDGVVRVEIGRVELRAPPSREPAITDRGVPKPDSFVSLKQYLRERGGT